MAFEPLFFGKAGGDDGDMRGFATDQQQADFTAPEKVVATAEVGFQMPNAGNGRGFCLTSMLYKIGFISR
ncbi:hypothetical protein TUM17563_57090 [Klebsiella oxytoca]|nr:hypothetical protein TUM17563_57090 [Klebsiella oxytoca]